MHLNCVDALRKERNVLVLTTSNLTGAIDRAFLDRVDMQLYVGPPGPRAAHHILHSILRELTDKQVNQCSGSGSTCFWASRIWILISTSKNSKKNLDSYCCVTSFGLFIFEK
jgi:SpoVK/Ycf46/Vps4 family AAA+-type ATPase